MIIYGFTIVTMPDDPEGAIDTTTRVFRSKRAFDVALDEIALGDNQDVNTFETPLES